MKIKHTMMALGAATLFMMPISAAQAFDGAAGAATQAEQPATAADVTDDKLKEFAEVHQEVESLNAEYQGKIQATSDVTEKSALSAEANKEMMDLVEKSPLTITEYNRIAQLVQQDIVLQDKYRQMLND
ncbi:MAG: DUF4168 domain-containing protein [Alphaproteobacteria bacterium]